MRSAQTISLGTVIGDWNCAERDKVHSSPTPPRLLVISAKKELPFLYFDRCLRNSCSFFPIRCTNGLAQAGGARVEPPSQWAPLGYSGAPPSLTAWLVGCYCTARRMAWPLYYGRDTNSVGNRGGRYSADVACLPRRGFENRSRRASPLCATRAARPRGHDPCTTSRQPQKGARPPWPVGMIPHPRPEPPTHALREWSYSQDVPQGTEETRSLGYLKIRPTKKTLVPGPYGDKGRTTQANRPQSRAQPRGGTSRLQAPWLESRQDA
jgi:hypothetical protein